MEAPAKTSDNPGFATMVTGNSNSLPMKKPEFKGFRGLQNDVPDLLSDVSPVEPAGESFLFSLVANDIVDVCARIH